MARERAVDDIGQDREVSEGSVEEITEEDFSHEIRGARGGGGRTSRVWTNEYVDFPRYLSRNHMISNIAWMQAVKNKPLSLAFGDAAGRTETPGSGLQEVCVISDSGDEKEEGELEEGEIDDVALPECVADDDVKSEILEVDMKQEMQVVRNQGVDLNEEKSMFETESMELEEPDDLDARVGLILEGLESLSEEEVEKSFDGGTLRVLRALEKLQRMVAEGHATFMDIVIQQAFATLETIHSVFMKNKEAYREVYARFLLCVRDRHSTLFTAEQMKEINSMLPHPKSEILEKTKVVLLPVNPVPVTAAANSIGSGLFPGKESLASVPVFGRNTKGSSQSVNARENRGEDSLPSLARVTRSNLVGPVAPFMEKSAHRQPAKKKLRESDSMFPYVTDVLKAVSSYHKKYDSISFQSNDRLPSPTPSDDGEISVNDIHGEVSSTSAAVNIKSVPFNCALSVPRSRGVSKDSPSGLVTGPFAMTGQISTEPIPGSKVSAKSRDPRLKLVNHNVSSAMQLNKQSLNSNHVEPKSGHHIQAPVMDPRKHRAVDECSFSENPLKRQRNDLQNSKGPQSIIRRGGWLEDIGNTSVHDNMRENGGNGWAMERNSTKVMEMAHDGGNNIRQTTSTSATLPFLEVGFNPKMLGHLTGIAENHKQLSDAAEVAPDFSDTNKPTAVVSSAENMPLNSLHPDQMLDAKAATSSEVPSSTNAVSNAGKPRMKPRDPRRVLQNITTPTNELLAPPLLKANGPSPFNARLNNDTSDIHNQGEQAQTIEMHCQSTIAPDISSQFTRNLKNIANMVSAPQGIVGNPVAPAFSTQALPSNILPAAPSSQSTSSKIDDAIIKDAAKGTNNTKCSSLVVGERTSSDASRLPDPWGDFDHLLDGYDDQQKAAIQRERARRIEEQNKMFSLKKLSLVLDLDHTLLNSAKFAEVDPNHSEILRKKEEMDRERPQRHLFRFQHMGMWTKLRPGIWNFLEKASKSYELHLYTMGNHLYATEMAKVLDPTGSLFGSRVISKGDENDLLDGDERVPRTKDLEGVKGMESAVVIVDDSVKVWPHNRLNLIVVERYTYFPCSRRQFGLLGPSLLEIDHDERPEDGTLASALAVIERIHHSFFSYPLPNNVDVRNILAMEQRKILAGCRIVFSRIFPVGEANPHLHPLWQTAEQFGAVCTNQIDDQVTHVVANSLGTDKVNWALSTGRFVVHHGWVEASALLYRRANEHDFAIKP